MLAAVRDEIGRLAEALATLPAFVRFLSCMYQHVFLHVRLLVKSFPAVLARERSDISVNQHVSGQSRRAFEMLPTGLALEYLNSGMSFSVLREADVMAEGLATRDTAVRTASCV